jgi:ABC-2 type transport system permease protein
VAEASRGPAGSIYDLGYRPYDGERLGRRYAINSLFYFSVRQVFGLGRSLVAKLFPFGLATIAAVPALFQLAFAAAAPAEFEAIPPQEYFEIVQIVVALFCAVSAPELAGRDQINRTLSLYFSRALSRGDYVATKLAALAAALFLVIAGPQLLMQVGNALAADDLSAYASDHVEELPAIVLSSLAAGALMACMSLAVACRAPRRAFGTGAVLAFFVLTAAITAILAEITTGDVQRYVVLLSPVDVLTGLGYWLFGAEPAEGMLRTADLHGLVYLAVTLAYAAASAGLLYRYFQRLAI